MRRVNYFMDELIIRQAEERDIDAIAQLDQLCFTTPWSRDSIEKEIIQNDIAIYIVAQIKEEVVGYAGLWKIIDEGHITNVAVHPQHRKKGIGEALVSVMLDYTNQLGVISHTLEVRPSNQYAIHLYEKLGFLVVGERKKYYEDNGEDALIMWRTQ